MLIFALLSLVLFLLTMLPAEASGRKIAFCLSSEVIAVVKK